MKQVQIIFLILIGFIFPLRLHAGILTTELERTEIEMGEQTILLVTVSGSLKGDLEIPQVDGLEFQQNGTSTNVQMVNGSFSKETTYSYLVTPLRPGSFVIPSLKAKIDKDEVATLPLNLSVAGGQGGKASNNAPSGGSGGDRKADSNDKAAPVFIERELAKSELFDGEAVISILRVFQQVRILGSVPERDPAPDWRIISREGQKAYDVERNGETWRVTEIREVLIPLKTGKLATPPFSLRVTYVLPVKRRQKMGNIWDMFRNGMLDMGENVTKKISSNSLSVNVLPLPEVGRPAVVSDIVGDFKVDVAVSKRTLKTQETSTVTLTLTGDGALDRMTELKPPTLLGAKVYADKPQLKETVTENSLKSTRQFQFAVVPTQAGSIDLGSIDFGVFDPKIRKWVTLTAALGTISVEGGVSSPIPLKPQPNTNEAATGANHNQIENPSQPKPVAQTPQVIPGLKTETADDPRPSSPKHWLTIALTLIGIFAVAFVARPVWRRYRRISFKSARRRPFQGLQKTLQEISPQDPASIVMALGALKQAVAMDSKNAAALTSREIAGVLRSWSIDEKVVQNAETVIGGIESHLYRDLPLTAVDGEALRKLYEQLVDVELA